MTDQTSAMRPILILLADGFADWETGLIAGGGPDFYGLDVGVASLDGGDVRSMGGLTVTGLQPFRPTGDHVIVVCGGTGFAAETGPALIAAMAEPLQQAQAAGATVAGICAGVRVLAEAGLLDGHRHTSNGRDWLNRVAPGYAGADLHVDQPQALRDGAIITAAGIAPVSFAAEVFAAAGVPDDKVAEFRTLLGAETAA